MTSDDDGDGMAVPVAPRDTACCAQRFAGSSGSYRQSTCIARQV